MGNGKRRLSIRFKVDIDKVQDASMVQFDMDEPVEVMIKKNNGMIHSVDIRPKSKGIEYKLIENCILFTFR